LTTLTSISEAAQETDSVIEHSTSEASFSKEEETQNHAHSNMMMSSRTQLKDAPNLEKIM